jgi:hypothetical protein
MARELGLNPRKLGKLDNHDQEPWKLPLPAFIQSLYQKRFGKDRPDEVHSIEERARLLEQKNAARREKSACGARVNHERVSVLRIPSPRPPPHTARDA